MGSQKPVAIFFFMSTCPHCQVMHTPWDELESEKKDTQFYKVESEHVPEELGIHIFPEFVVAQNGKVKKSVGGEMSKDDLKTKLFGTSGGRRRTRVRRGRSRRLTRRGRKVAH